MTENDTIRIYDDDVRNLARLSIRLSELSTELNALIRPFMGKVYLKHEQEQPMKQEAQEL